MPQDQRPFLHSHGRRVGRGSPLPEETLVDEEEEEVLPSLSEEELLEEDDVLPSLSEDELLEELLDDSSPSL